MINSMTFFQTFLEEHLKKRFTERYPIFGMMKGHLACILKLYKFVVAVVALPRKRNVAHLGLCATLMLLLMKDGSGGWPCQIQIK